MAVDLPFGGEGRLFQSKPVMTPRVPLAAGQVVDGFRVESHLHQGTNAHLWRVSAIGAGPDSTPLVMKVPRLKGTDDPVTLVGFEAEQMILPSLTGVHVPRFVAKGDFNGQPYLVTELIAGPSLRPKMEAAPLPIREVVDIAVRVTNALHALHRQNVVHLDVKPSNIMFRPLVDGVGGEAVLVDLSSAHHDHLPDLMAAELALPPTTVGPLLSPEQVQSLRSDPRSDIFALGVMLYSLLTGERPFDDPDSARDLRDPIPLRTLRPECPPWLQEIVLRCLEATPDKRHSTAAQLAFDLMHHEQVALTERATRRQRSGKTGVMRRWFSALGTEEATVKPTAAAQVAQNPIVMVALDFEQDDPAMLDTLRLTTQRLLQIEPGARLACLVILKTARGAKEEPLAKEPNGPQAQWLVQLKHWARPLIQALKLPIDAPSGRVSFHVLQSADPAAAIIEHARKHQADHIVIGASRSLGSVPSQVMVQSSCSVTLVRPVLPQR